MNLILSTPTQPGRQPARRGATFSTAILTALCALGAAGWAGPAQAHISLEQAAAPAGGSYKAVFRVGHGCEGAATHSLLVRIPTGFGGARPMPKAGWTLELRREKLATPYARHGTLVSEDVVEVRWRAATPEAALADAHYDEFVLRGQLPDTPGPLWFKLLQVCEQGANDWSELPASGTSTRGLKNPAVLLDVQPAQGGHHTH